MFRRGGRLLYAAHSGTTSGASTSSPAPSPAPAAPSPPVPQTRAGAAAAARKLSEESSAAVAAQAKPITPIQFFNEAFFRPQSILDLTPENLLEQLKRLPQDAKLLRVYGSSFYITHNTDVIGILSPMMCQAVPFKFPVGGITIEDYIIFLEVNKSVLVNVVTSGSTMVATVNPNGDPILGPHVFDMWPEGHDPDGRESVRDLYSDAPFYQEYFGWFKAYHHEINECGTFWVKAANHSTWRQIVKVHSTYYSRQLYEMNFNDPRWLPTTPHMYYPKIFNFEKKVINVDGVFNTLRSGQIALKTRL